MSRTSKPTFTDVNGVEVYASLIELDGRLRLRLDDQEGREILLLNFYDAKQMEASVKLFLNQRYGEHLSEMRSELSDLERAQMFGDELDGITDRLKEEAEKDKQKHPNSW